MNIPLQTTVVLAMTADGKIADSQRSPARFGSPVDRLHLEKQVSLVDAVLFGAATLRAYGTTISITNPELLQARLKRGQVKQPVQIVVSASGNISPQLKFFNQPVPHWLLTTDGGAKFWQSRTEFEKILVTDSDDNHQFDWVAVFSQLKTLGFKKLAILGGGELVASLFGVDLIDELWLTVCPLILGGSNSPTPVTGMGFTPSQAKRLQLLEVKQVEAELFLHYLVKRELVIDN